MQPLVSIIIPVYNGANYLKQAIDSALAQTYKNIEIIVVNDGSNDGGATERIALSYGDRIRYFAKENGGSSSALNYGIKNMYGDWFSWLSHDDLYYPDKVKKQIKYLANMKLSEDEVSNHILFSEIEYIDGQGLFIKHHKRKKQVNINGEDIGNEYLIAEPTKYNFYGCTCLIHKKMFDKVGLFDESLRLVNDIDMWFRLYSSGAKVHLISEVLAQARLHVAQVSRSIGFSYHNPEQDMLWSRSLKWLEENHPDNYELFFRFGRNAFLKTRNTEGRRAFLIAASIRPEKRLELYFKQLWYLVYACVWQFAKSMYIRLKM